MLFRFVYQFGLQAVDRQWYSLALVINFVSSLSYRQTFAKFGTFSFLFPYVFWNDVRADFLYSVIEKYYEFALDMFHRNYLRQGYS